MAVNLKRLSVLLKQYKLFNYSMSRNISTTTPRMENVLENLQDNPYYNKYADRIAALQKTSPEEFLQRLEEQQKNKKGESKKKFAPIDTSQYSSVLKPKDALQSDVANEDKKLSDIFKIDLVQDKEASEIQAIWEVYHKNREVISATVPKNVYVVMQENMKKYPTFLFPLPRSQGYEFIMCQNYGSTVHFTPLLAYQVHKENAPECLTMVHYTEFIEKGIILMRGEYDKNVLTGKEAQCLANQFQMYYSGKDQNKLQLLANFTDHPDTFKHMDLISQLESITLV
ncbi:ATP synthase mitochondrial F1 complex assembly factor 1 [Achroia grisella]|uniref:ATP synthase mitochondrial F1 complex assembly factor 1 n=1 Tax=Achroia grisella TaxID=688607 RepID=UPI0027D31735|nr:ATP synthase mitochondrial F1 complex assembly factor 1 [Achroia grisella]XP_059054601.1 ATP synthase mitochondrial F1 complex assembly factor 1 [Achroia grisella]XP_059054602.1 ATP synthase mitochondrial F1 complex assembly factor 1 [Achroia grisella]XP_059054603.1 ATP synthase mitochondrial F1 complex assembly factor 1 [Achroia grisella]